MLLQCLFCIVGEVFQSCQLAAGLYVVGTVLDVLMHCSLSAAIGEPNVKFGVRMLIKLNVIIINPCF